MSNRDVLIFANPIAGRGRGRAIAGTLAKALHAADFRPIVVLERPDQMSPAVDVAGAHAAIAIGGDGTIRGVARALYPNCIHETRDVPHAPPMLIVPMGTANLLGKHLGIKWNARTLARQVVDAIVVGKTVQLDAACVNDDLFLLMAGIGIDAHIVHELDRMRRGPITMASYLMPAAAAIGLYQYPPISVTIDGKRVCNDMPGMAFVGNVAEYGTGFPILPHARPDDEMLDVCVLPCRTRLEVAKFFLLAAGGEHLREEGVIYAKAKDVRITSNESVPVQVDGEAAGHTPVHIRLLRTRVPFIVPSAKRA